MGLEEDVSAFVKAISQFSFENAPQTLVPIENQVMIQQAPVGHIMTIALGFKIDHVEIMNYKPTLEGEAIEKKLTVVTDV